MPKLKRVSLTLSTSRRKKRRITKRLQEDFDSDEQQEIPRQPTVSSASVDESRRQ